MDIFAFWQTTTPVVNLPPMLTGGGEDANFTRAGATSQLCRCCGAGAAALGVSQSSRILGDAHEICFK